MLIVAGREDVSDVLRIADRLERGIAGARKVMIDGTAHLPGMEKPEVFNQIALDTLADCMGWSMSISV